MYKSCLINNKTGLKSVIDLQKKTGFVDCPYKLPVQCDRVLGPRQCPTLNT